MYTEVSPLLPLGSSAWSPPALLTFAELQDYATRPAWIRARRFVLFLSGLTWVSLLSLSLSIAIAAHGCRSSTLRRERCIAQDGVSSKLDYLSSLNVTAVWLSPVFKSPMKDFGYDISDFRDIDPIFGNMDDFRSLVSDMKDRGIRLILDLVPNHSSDQHEWFLKSARNEEPYTDYYVWAKPKTASDDNTTEPQPPNNWLSVFGGSAWKYHETRREFYLHQFAPEQPDLNFRNPKVLQEMQEILRFWLNAGVSGFRIDAAPHMLEDEQLRDEPRSSARNVTALPDEYDYLEHVYTHGLQGNLDIIKAFRQTLNEFASNSSDPEPRLLMAEVYDSVDRTTQYYGTDDEPLADFPFNFLLVSELGSEPSAEKLQGLVLQWIHNMPSGSCANWVLSNHDRSRVATRVGSSLVDGLNMVSLLLPGVAVTYYGEELGLQDVSLTWEQTVDPAGRNAGPERYAKHSRDPQRAPMQWSDDTQAGFSNSESTWLPVHENYKSGVHVTAQQRDPRSHLAVFKALVLARDTEAIKYGHLDVKVLPETQVFAYTRIHDAEGFAVIVNLDSSKVVADLPETFKALPDTAQLYTCNSAYNGKIGASVDTKTLSLESKDAVVLKFKVTSTSSSEVITT